VLGKRTGALSVVQSRVGPPRPLRPQEADDAALVRVNGEPSTEHGRSGSAAKGWAGSVRGLADPAGNLAHVGANGEASVTHDPADATAHEGASAPAGADALDGVHAPTARVIRQLRQARHKLQRAASPELQLSPAIRALWRTEMRLARPLRVAVCGEVNSGKSSLANLLAGIESLPTAILSNTRIPTLLQYAPQPEIWTVRRNGKRVRLRSDRSMPREEIFRIDVGLPSQRLQTVQIVDLPGLVDPRSGFLEIDLTAHHVDAAIWCTMSTQAWKESERTVWSLLPARLGSRGLLVATHRDLLHDPRDCEKLMGRLRDEVASSFAGIILLSTTEALAVMGKDRLDDGAWIASGGQALESALGSLLMHLREQRAAAALRMTSRVAHRALLRIDEEAHSGT
jgi:Dynamin family